MGTPGQQNDRCPRGACSRARAALLVISLFVMLSVSVARGIAAGGSAGSDWSRYGWDNQQTNYRPASSLPGLKPDTAHLLHAAWRDRLDGGIVASPLYAAGHKIGTRTRNVLYAATEGGSLYALDAADGRTLWRRKLGKVPTPCQMTYGISSTGVLDRSANRLFVIGASGLLHSIDIRTGAEKAGWPLRLITHTDAEHVWGGLTLNRKVGLLYVPVASYCDETGADGYRGDGRLVAVDLARAKVTAQLDVVPGVQNLGGIWGYGGTSIDPATGHVWTATGNAANNGKDATPLAEQVLELDPRSLTVLANNHPAGIEKYDDGDFGSTPLLFQPPGCDPLAAAYAKNGVLYVWRRAALASGPIWSVRIGFAGAGPNPFVGEPSYSPLERALYVSEALRPDSNGAKIEGAAAFKVASGCKFPNAPTWTTKVGAGVKPPALIVGDVLFVPGGDTPRLYALDARNGAVVWNASLGGAGYSSPILAGSEIIAGSFKGGLTAFRMPAR